MHLWGPLAGMGVRLDDLCCIDSRGEVSDGIWDLSFGGKSRELVVTEIQAGERLCPQCPHTSLTPRYTLRFDYEL